MPISQPKEVKGEIGLILKYPGFVVKKQEKFLQYDLLKNEYDTLRKFNGFSHFPAIIEYTGLTLILDNC